MVLLILFLGVVIALLAGAAYRPPTKREDEAAKTIGKAVHNMVAVQFGESLAGQQQWELGPPPPPTSFEPVGETVVRLDEASANALSTPEAPPPEPPRGPTD